MFEAFPAALADIAAGPSDALALARLGPAEHAARLAASVEAGLRLADRGGGAVG